MQLSHVYVLLGETGNQPVVYGWLIIFDVIEPVIFKLPLIIVFCAVIFKLLLAIISSVVIASQ